MPHLTDKHPGIHYEVYGDGPETIVFSHGYLMNLHMYDHQIKALSARYRIVAFDHRGHGRSPNCRKSYGIYDLMDDALRVISATCDGPVHFVGMSTGGYVGLRLLLRHPELLKSLILIDTAASGESSSMRWQYELNLLALRLVGVRPLLPEVFRRLFGKTIRADPARKALLAHWRAQIAPLDARSMLRFANAIFGRDDVLPEIAKITPPPTLILVGEEDIATPPERSREMHAAMKGSTLFTIPGSGHTSPVESPEFVTAKMQAFLEKL